MAHASQTSAIGAWPHSVYGFAACAVSALTLAEVGADAVAGFPVSRALGGAAQGFLGYRVALAFAQLYLHGAVLTPLRWCTPRGERLKANKKWAQLCGNPDRFYPALRKCDGALATSLALLLFFRGRLAASAAATTAAGHRALTLQAAVAGVWGAVLALRLAARAAGPATFRRVFPTVL